MRLFSLLNIIFQLAQECRFKLATYRNRFDNVTVTDVLLSTPDVHGGDTAAKYLALNRIVSDKRASWHTDARVHISQASTSG